MWTRCLQLNIWEWGIFSFYWFCRWNIHALCVENEKTHGRVSWNASGTSLPWGDGVFHSCELFSFQSGRKSSVFVLYPRIFWLPDFFFCNLRTVSILYSTYVVSHLPWNVKMIYQTLFIKNKQSKNPQDFQIANCLFDKALNVSLDLRACVCHNVMSLTVRPFSTTLVPGKFLSASWSGVSILKSPSWGYYLSVYIINLSTCSALAHSVKSRKIKLRHACSAVFKTLALGQYGYLCQENEGKVPELWR